MNDAKWKDLYWNNASVIVDVMELVQCIRMQNEHRLSLLLPVVMRQISKSISGFASEGVNPEDYGLSWSMTDLMSILSEMEKCQSRGDYIAYADLLEMHIIPMLYDLQRLIQGCDIQLFEMKWYEDNLNALRYHNKQLANALEAYGSKQQENEQDDSYLAQTSCAGHFTLAVKHNGSYRNLHSTQNPIWEARMFAKRSYHMEHERYLVIGWGMGYHIRELLHLDSDLDIIVYEPDVGILYHSLLLGDWKEDLNRVQIAWTLEELTELWKEEREIILWKPELALLEDDRWRSKLQRIAERKDSIDDFVEVFYQNFRENTKNCDAYVDEIREVIQGRKVVVVAGGPSLDKNINELRNKDANTVIFAVGTVFRLLVEKKIAVDYVVFSDSYVSHQVVGLETCETPIIVLSTADRRIVRNYSGRKYLVCQKGYEPAKKYAENKGHMCYDSGGSVATLALDIAIRLRAKAIACVGLDLAYYGTRAHASGTAQETYDGFEHHQVEGVNGERLNSSQAFIRYREWMERRIRQEDVTMRIVDATEGGAKKKGFEVMTLKEFLES